MKNVGRQEGFSWDLLYWLCERTRLGIITRGYSLKQHSTVEYLACYLDSDRNDELLVRRVLKKINAKLNFSWRQSNYLNYSSRRLLSNAFIQPHFDYGCTSWYPVLSKTLKIKLQFAQNKCIRFCFHWSRLVYRLFY